jgi:predicted Co/Zn/Cd cation transporter (cation efflux family)
MVDPHIRLQNIALETSELQAQRQMSWTEATNRASMFMTVVGATVFGLALVGNATSFDRSFLLLSLLVLLVLLFVGISSLARLTELDRHDWKMVQGLNRLRHLRVELDPAIGPHLVTSPYDDLESVLSSYGDNNPALHSFWTLDALIGTVVAVLCAFLAALIAVTLSVDGGVATVAGVAAFFGAFFVAELLGFAASNRRAGRSSRSFLRRRAGD